MAEDIVLDDLAHPRFTPDVAELLSAGASLAGSVAFEPEPLCDAAMAETGLDDFGPDSWQEPFEVLLRSLREEADLGAMGRVAIGVQISQLLRNRLLLVDLLDREPAIDGGEIRQPLVICGLPRTGTTHLHNLLAADPRLRSLPWWEALEPIPRPDERGLAGPPDDPRRARTAGALATQDAVLPHFKAMHEMTVSHVHEEIHLLALEFCTMFFDTLAPMPRWRAWYRNHDHRPHYEFLRTTLAAIDHLRAREGRAAGERWVLKSPQHLEQFPVLADVFADATFVVTHRDPGSVALSLAGMLAYVARLHFDPPVPVRRIAGYWNEVVPQMLESARANRDALGERSVDIRFDDFTADQGSAVDAIYSVAGLPLTEEARSAHAAYEAEHRQHRHGRVRYDLVADELGVDPAAQRAKAAAYCARFNV